MSEWLWILMLWPFISVNLERNNGKRILLDDPNYVLDQELTAIKAKLQEYENRIAKMEANATDQKREITNLRNKLAAEQQITVTGAVYVRWGRKTCPDNNTELVYSGVAGGSYYAHTGVAAEYVCLPTDQIWNKYDDTVADYNAKMYGGEYHNNFFSKNLGNSEAPCAVCRRLLASATIMLPGRNICYSGWNQEYSGYLASGGWPNNHKAASQYVCLDENPESVIHSGKVENGKLFYMVEGICGSLPCPPYINGRELTCAVCSK